MGNVNSTLNFYPWSEWQNYRDIIVAAKKATGIDVAVTPREAQAGNMKVVCVKEPPFLCDYALIQSGSVEGFTSALLWYFGIKDDPRVITVEKTLSKIFGAKVTKVEGKKHEDRIVNPEPKPEIVVKPRPRDADRDSSGYLW